MASGKGRVFKEIIYNFWRYRSNANKIILQSEHFISGTTLDFGNILATMRSMFMKVAHLIQLTKLYKKKYTILEMFSEYECCGAIIVYFQSGACPRMQITP
uniref:Uncharacterized protein n=1 Tax=Lepeophtheirus salmonis TaxID=72036 RepID=A0A0K2T7S8_LEPSM